MPATAAFAAKNDVRDSKNAPAIPGEPRKIPSSLLIGFTVVIAPACCQDDEIDERPSVLPE
jgi:hypothetical protein